jgi:3-methyladenine DNA glycosylase AlkD
MHTSCRTILQQSLAAHANPKSKAWWERYVKGSAPFLGVKMAAIRSIVHQWHEDHVGGDLDLNRQLDLALALFEGEYTEEKLAGTLFLQEILLPADAIQCARDLDRFAELFSEGRIHDWNVCDWFCVKVLGPLIEQEGFPCAERIAIWRDAANLWQARASLVAFVPVADVVDCYPLIERSCQVVIQRPERFAKTAVGWILREISKHDTHFVRRVLDEQIQHFTSESLKNAVKYLSAKERKAYRRMLKEAKLQ